MDGSLTAKVLAALGHEGRLSIFRLLVRAGPQGLPAGEVARRTGQLQNTSSTHLGVLSNVGLVSARREGRSIIYAVTPASFTEALEFLTEDFFQDPTGDRTPFFRRLLEAFEDGPRGEADVHAARGGNAA